MVKAYRSTFLIFEAMRNYSIFLSLAVALLAGCLGGPPDEIGLTTSLYWSNSAPLELCVGDTVRLAIAKYIVDSSANTWKSIDTAYPHLAFRVWDPDKVHVTPGGFVHGLEPAASSIQAVDTLEGLRTPWRKISVKNCP